MEVDSIHVKFQYELKDRETQKARLFGFTHCQVWIPKSQILGEKKQKLRLPEWLAKEKQLV